MPKAEIALDVRADVGEAPIWDVRTQALLWVDLPLGRVHRFDPVVGTNRYFEVVGQPVCAVATCSDTRLALVTGKGLAFGEWGEQPSLTTDVGGDHPGGRMNDGKCDARGRFWAGSLNHLRAGTSSLYRFDTASSAVRILSGVSTSNGLGWSPDQTLMYYVDSACGRVDVFDFDLSTGTVANRRQFIEVPDGVGIADGMTVDSLGGVWVAFYGGGVVNRYSPEGRLDAVVLLPARLVTSCTFGGSQLEVLYITTASKGSDEPLAGAIFAYEGGVQGLQPGIFGESTNP